MRISERVSRDVVNITNKIAALSTAYERIINFIDDTEADITGEQGEQFMEAVETFDKYI